MTVMTTDERQEDKSNLRGSKVNLMTVLSLRIRRNIKWTVVVQTISTRKK